MQGFLNRLLEDKSVSKNELSFFIEHYTEKDSMALFSYAREARNQYYGKKIYLRGLIEFTNYCKNNCYYCGIQRSNQNISRFRLTLEEILSCCEAGDRLGFSTFVLQGGEDPYFTDEKLVEIITAIKSRYQQKAITLSVGERSYESYQKLFQAGADRYLLRHETANSQHYGLLHPSELTLKNRKECLFALKRIGFQVGAGFMVGSPYQTYENLAEDLLFLKELSPHMVGIGPFIPHHDTKFAKFPAGSLELTLVMLALCRLLLKKALLPCTTALGSIQKKGREMGFDAGGNVVMPNLSPPSYREKYALYDNKIATGAESAEGLSQLLKLIEDAGYEPDFSRGDYIDLQKN